MHETAHFQTMDKELEVLRHLHRENDLRQRDLAEIAGLSLGMTNAIVKRLAVKGFLTVRKVNNRNIRYAVSSAGVEEIAKRSYKYVKRTIKNIAHYKDRVDELLQGIRAQGFLGVVLEGGSDVDFIVEHLCRKNGLGFRRSDGARNAGAGVAAEGDFVLHGENIPPPTSGPRRGSAYLRSVLMQERTWITR